jgi:hypothetical protein
MTTFTKQVNDGPVIVPLLKVRQLQPNQLGTPQATAQKKSQDGMISFALCILFIRGIEKAAPLSAGKPIPEPSTELFCAFHTPDTCCEIGTEQSIVGSLVGQSAHRRRPQVDGCWGEPSSFQFITVAKNDGSAERQSGFGAVPGSEVIYGKGTRTFRGNRTKASQN